MSVQHGDGEIMRKAVAVITALGRGWDYRSYRNIVDGLDRKQTDLLVVALAGIAFGLAERAADHEQATIEEVLGHIGLDVAEIP